MPERDDRMLVSATGVRNAFVLSGVGMVAVVVLFLILATAQPQGTYQSADDSQYRATLAGASQDLEGFELIGDGGARIDIERAMELVVERGVDLSMTAVSPESDFDAHAGHDHGHEGEDDAAEEVELTETEAFFVRLADATEADGRSTYANCVACHQAAGTGVPGAFPPLAGGHAAELALARGGREYLVNALLHGVQGQIVVAGRSYNGVMPAWQQLSEDQIAAVLNYIVAGWDNIDQLPLDFRPFTAREVTLRAEEGLSAQEVLGLRPDVP